MLTGLLEWAAEVDGKRFLKADGRCSGRKKTRK